MDHVATLFENQKYKDIKDTYFENFKSIDALTCYFLTISLMMLEAFEDAETCFKFLKKTATGFPDFFTYYALCLIRLGKYKKAKSELKFVTEKNRLFYECNVEVSLKLAQLRRAKKLIKEAAAAGIESKEMAINDAVISFLSIKYDEAEKNFKNL